MVTFGLILAAEAALDLLIDQTAPDTWLDQLSPSRQDKIRKVFAGRQKDNAEIGLLQCCNLDDRLTVAAKLGLWRHTWLPKQVTRSSAHNPGQRPGPSRQSYGQDF